MKNANRILTALAVVLAIAGIVNLAQLSIVLAEAAKPEAVATLTVVDLDGQLSLARWTPPHAVVVTRVEVQYQTFGTYECAVLPAYVVTNGVVEAEVSAVDGQDFADSGPMSVDFAPGIPIEVKRKRLGSGCMFDGPFGPHLTITYRQAN